MSKNHVLIAGAGPVGLVAANCLADAGAPVTVFEAEPQLPENLRASTFQPPTLDLLSQLGASQRLIEMGRIARTMQYRDRLSRRGRGASQQSAGRHGHERRHTRRRQPRQTARARGAGRGGPG